MSFAQRFSPKANEIKLKQGELTVAGIKQMYMDCPSEDQKYEILVKLYGLMTVGSSIIFVKVYENSPFKKLIQLLIPLATKYRHRD